MCKLSRALHFGVTSGCHSDPASKGDRRIDILKKFDPTVNASGRAVGTSAPPFDSTLE